MSAVEYCDCGHRVSGHRAAHTPGGQRGACLRCRCQAVTQTVKWTAAESTTEEHGHDDDR